MAGIFAAALVLVFLLFKLILGDFGPAGNNKSYEVPDVRGMTVGEAQLMDGVKDVFEIVVKGTQRSDTYEAGQIIQQSPEAGRSRKSNFVIEVYVAAEEVKVDMPNVTGKEYRQARIELQELKLDLQFEFLSQNSDSYAKDTVISTAPAAGEALKQGQKVTLYVSTGPKTVTVPTFLGQDIAMAIKTAQDMGLTVGQPLFDPFSSVETGRVTEQSIKPQQVVDGGTPDRFHRQRQRRGGHHDPHQGGGVLPAIGYGRHDQGGVRAGRRDRRQPVHQRQPPDRELYVHRSGGRTHHWCALTLPASTITRWHLHPRRRLLLSRGRIEKALSGFYYVNTGDEVLRCRARGKFRREGLSPLVGDWVQVRELGGGEGFVEAVEPRKNVFLRPSAANIDQLVIIASAAIPVTEPYLIDRIAAIAALKSCQVLLCLNKCDLDPADELYGIYPPFGH